MTPSNEMPLEIWAERSRLTGDLHAYESIEPCDGETKYLRATPDKVMIDRAELERVRNRMIVSCEMIYCGEVGSAKMNLEDALQILEAALKGE